MKRRVLHLPALLLAASAGCLQAAEPVPVVEVSSADAVTASASTGVQTDLYFMLQQLQDEVRALRGTVEQQQYRLDQLEQQQLERYRAMDKRVSLLIQQLPMPSGRESLVDPLETAGGAASAPVGAGAPSSRSTQAESNIAVPATVAQARDVDSGQSAYDAAFGKVRQRDFSGAERALKGFIEAYPDSPLLANAWYWLGEVYLAEQKSESSRAAFTRVIEEFGTHSKAADASYKLGVLAGREGDESTARQWMQKVVQEYPKAPAADLARGYLKP
ncbi:tol-pal system protein YbgF [Marinobacterium weihaiense]|uniref:Cell division coordinator CpoB n=1 Tax=Marinobacterium weihaiense TaxID=2851016 RepID=A0ABS6M8I7_9GAMM|nr:tol-pal system protein YbgF [Marinobacterium weihaiense]MBV0932201.1 tol-pal system protein YbgF [Marinobacterium weihaiense]